MSDEPLEPKESALKLAGDYISARDAIISARRVFSEFLNTILHKARAPESTAEQIRQGQDVLRQEIRELADWYVAMSVQWIEATRKLYETDLGKFEEFLKLRQLNQTLAPVGNTAVDKQIEVLRSISATAYNDLYRETGLAGDTPKPRTHKTAPTMEDELSALMENF